MKKIIGFVFSLSLLIMFGLIIWSRFPQKESATGSSDVTRSKSHPPDNDDESPPVVGTYKILDGQQIRPEIGKGTSAYIHVYSRKHLWVYGHANAPANLPRLEIRFLKPSPKGGMKSCKLRAMEIEAWRDGGRNMARRTSQEVSFPMGFRQQGVEITGAKTVRTLITDDLELEKFQGLYMGRMYYLYFKQLGFEGKHKTPDKWGSCLLRVPEDVPPGKVAVMEVDVTQKIDPYQVEMSTVRVRVNGQVPGKGIVQLAVPGGRTKSAQLNSDGSAKIQVEKLGGEMAVLSLQRKDVGHLLYYKRKVDSEEINFPGDADVVVSPEEVLEFRIKVPRKEVPLDSHGLALLMHRDSSVPVAGMEFAEVEGEDMGRKGDLPVSVPLMAPAGSYYVAYGFREPNVVGKVDVGKSDVGKTLEVQPLEE